jgi:hypothetical protein
MRINIINWHHFCTQLFFASGANLVGVANLAFETWRQDKALA